MYGKLFWFAQKCLNFSPFFIQDETRTFRRHLEEKRAIIENNLLTGRQHLQSAAAAAAASGGNLNNGDHSMSSDTSESDGESKSTFEATII